MKKLFVLSDTHKNTGIIKRLLPKMQQCDLVVHLGDYVSDIKGFAAQLKGKLITVGGNGDIFSSALKERVIELEGIKILCCHGHRYGVKSSLISLERRAAQLGCALALYGHTHIADIKQTDSALLVNPGCMTVYSEYKSYAHIIIDDGQINAEIINAADDRRI